MTFAAAVADAVATDDGLGVSSCDCCHTVSAAFSNTITLGGSRCVEDAGSNIVE
jgi:hypothetical protein